MRRAFAILSISALGLSVSTANAQYPYPYGPMPVQYGQQYAPMPAQYAQPYGQPMYTPYPMPQRPVYYYPPPVQMPVMRMEQPAPIPRTMSVTTLPDDDKPLAPAIPPASETPPPPAASVSAPESRTLPSVLKTQPDITLPAAVDLTPDLQPRSAPSRGGIYAAFGVYLVTPHFQGNPAFQTSVNAPGTPIFGSQRDFSYGMTLSPQATIGYESDSGLGVRGNWWRFDQRAEESTTVGQNGFVTAANPLALGGALATAPGDVITANSHLRLDVIDLEITSRWEPTRCWSILVGGGVRYANISQDYSFNATSPGVGPTGQVDFNHTFSGVGPTLSFEARRNFGDSGFGLYSTGRGAILFGTVTQRADLSNVNAAGVFALAASNDASRSQVMPVVELEIGAEYRHAIGRAQLFVQSGFVGHAWFGAGNSSNTDSSFTGNTNNNITLGFIGLAVRAGVKY
jgi:hypothetical protein